MASAQTRSSRVSELAVGDVIVGPYGGTVVGLDRYGAMVSITIERDGGRIAQLTWPPDGVLRLAVDDG